MGTERTGDEDLKPVGRRRGNAAARADLTAARSMAMPARHRQKLAHIAASPAAQPLVEHLNKLRATAKAMTATTDHTEEPRS